MKELERKRTNEGKNGKTAYETFIIMMGKLNNVKKGDKRPFSEANAIIDASHSEQATIRVLLDELRKKDPTLADKGLKLLDEVKGKREQQKELNIPELKDKIGLLSAAVTEKETTVIGGIALRTALQVVREPFYQRQRVKEMIGDLPATAEKRIQDNLRVAERIVYNGKRRG